MILTGLHPNTTSKHISLVREYMNFPKLYLGNKEQKLLESSLFAFPGVKSAHALDSGRSALYIALKALNLPNGSAIGLSAYTCIVVRNAIIQAGYVPHYIDIDDSLSISPEALEKNTSIKALVTQHTFGVIHKEYEKILQFAKKQGIPIIEDAAHIIDKKKTNVDMRILSFGPEKSISAIRGGAVLVYNELYTSAINELANNLPVQPTRITKRLARTQLLFNKLRLSYPRLLTKILLLLAKTLHITMPIIEKNELKGITSKWSPAQIGGINAAIALNELRHIELRNTHRKKILNIYKSILPHNAIIQRTHNSNSALEIAVYVTKKPSFVLERLKQEGIHLSPSWLYSPIVPAKSFDSLSSEEHKNIKECLQLHTFINDFVTLPTHHQITSQQAYTIVTSLLPYV